jgi:histone H3
MVKVSQTHSKDKDKKKKGKFNDGAGKKTKSKGEKESQVKKTTKGEKTKTGKAEKSKTDVSTEKPTEAKHRKPFRHRYGVAAMIKARREMKRVDLSLRKRPFSRIVRGIAEEVDMGPTSKPLRFTKGALESLQEVVESFLIRVFASSEENVIFNKKKRLSARYCRHIGHMVYPDILEKKLAIEG